ncbi:MAG TPA: hypothetical protein VK783_00685 [Bacteroidia bacterium]|jgi:hypothetical protein|nr:hypothetical protein [Bacteroidia bacterium]
MGVLIFILLAGLALIGYCSYAISRTVYLRLKKNENRNAMAIAVVLFIVAFAVIFFAVSFVLNQLPIFRR